MLRLNRAPASPTQQSLPSSHLVPAHGSHDVTASWWWSSGAGRRLVAAEKSERLADLDGPRLYHCASAAAPPAGVPDRVRSMPCISARTWRH